jgi:PleD family two-component response regulator
VATKKKNLRQRKPSSRPQSNKSHKSNTQSQQSRGLSAKALSYLDCCCEDRYEILVVDDNIFNIMTLQTIIECSLKMQTDKALNGKEAVQKVMKMAEENDSEPCKCSRKRTNYKIIFMDCNMPIMDGF